MAQTVTESYTVLEGYLDNKTFAEVHCMHVINQLLERHIMNNDHVKNKEETCLRLLNYVQHWYKPISADGVEVVDE